MVGARRLRWGVVGCGWVARDYVIPAIEGSGNGDLVLLCDRDPAALAALRRPGVTMTSELAVALDPQRVDALYVATPNDAHAAIAGAALDAGVAVLCEKPLAHDLASARHIVDAAARSDATYATAFDQRFHAAHRTLRAMVERGELGTVTQARLHYACWVGADWAADNWRVDAQRSGGGALIDLAPHCVDLVDWLIGDGSPQVHAFLQRRVHAYDVDDGAVLSLRWANQAVAVIQVGYNCPEALPRRRLELIGTKAMAVAENTMGQTAGGRLTLIDACGGGSRSVPLCDDRSPFLVGIEAFADAVLAGRPFGFPPDRDLRLFEALMHAVETDMTRDAFRPTEKPRL